MRIDLRELRKSESPVALQGNVELARIVEENSQVTAMEPIHADLVAQMSTDIALVQGRLSTKISYQCSRCLDSYVTPLRLNFHERFSNVKQPGEEEVHVVAADEVDLTAYIEEAVNLAIEFRPLCSSECKGLCTVCGVNRNRESCTCEVPRPIDPRLAALEGLLSKDDSQ